MALSCEVLQSEQQSCLAVLVGRVDANEQPRDEQGVGHVLTTVPAFLWLPLVEAVANGQMLIIHRVMLVLVGFDQGHQAIKTVSFGGPVLDHH